MFFSFKFLWSEVPFFEISQFVYRLYYVRIAISRKWHFWSPKLYSKNTFKYKVCTSQKFPQNLGKLTSETTFCHSKVVFQPLLRTKRTFSQNPLIARFWNFVGWMWSYWTKNWAWGIIREIFLYGGSLRPVVISMCATFTGCALGFIWHRRKREERLDVFRVADKSRTCSPKNTFQKTSWGKECVR